MERAGYVYVLHFDEKLSHAQHYIGCTHELRERLTAHAVGRGSRLCQVLLEKGISWQLGAVGSCSHREIRRKERQLKNWHHSKEFCTICAGEYARKIPGTTPYPITSLPFPTNSIDLAKLAGPAKEVTVRFTTENDPDDVLKQVLHLSKADKDALGFIPIGGQEGINVIARAGKVCVAERDGRIVGYTAFTENEYAVNIQQCCVKDGERGCGIGKKMVSFVHESRKDKMMYAKVRFDLAANDFWKAIGFKLVAQVRHKTSGNELYVWEHPRTAWVEPNVIIMNEEV